MFKPFKRPRTRSPFRGKPMTWTLYNRDRSLRGFRVKLEYLTPLRAKIADGAAIASAIGAMVGVIQIAPALPPQNEGLVIVAALAPAAAYPMIKFFYRRALRKSTLVEITRDLFRINGLFGWKTYDRNLPHRFALMQHDNAQEEWEDCEFAARKAAMKGKVLRETKYYQDSRHVVFDYVLQRIDVADVYGLDRKSVV